MQLKIKQGLSFILDISVGPIGLGCFILTCFYYFILWFHPLVLQGREYIESKQDLISLEYIQEEG